MGRQLDLPMANEELRLYGELRVEVDSHTTGLFCRSRRGRGCWRRRGPFAWERVDYPVSADGTPLWLWVRELRAE